MANLDMSASFMITPEDRANVPALYFVSRILLLH